MGRQRTPASAARPKRKVYIRAEIDEDNELCVQSRHVSSPERAMATLIQTAQQWVSDAAVGAAPASAAPASAARSAAARELKETPRVPVAPAVAPNRMFSFLDALPIEDLDEDVLCTMSKDEKLYFLGQNGKMRSELVRLLRKVHQGESTMPMRFRVLLSRLPAELKSKIISKLDKQRDALTPGDSMKYNSWLEVILSLPLGEVIVPQPGLAVAESMAKAKAHLDAIVYGQRAAKSAILERFYQWIVAPTTPQRPMALCGVPGNGKTTLIREGLARIMARPFAFVTLGGSMDSSMLLGHSYTYEGSTPGRVVEHLISSRCANPVFYFDELDKCSSTPKGDEVINALVHFTDPAQSDKFRDRYVGNLDIDTSRALCVFSFNNASAISSVLLDRLQVVDTDEFDAQAQSRIAYNYLVPQILKERDVDPDSVRFELDEINRASKLCCQGGVRGLRSVLEQAVTKALLWRDAADPDFLLPMKPCDIEQRDGVLLIKGGLTSILREMKDAGGRPPPGMYA